jgi:PIN domain nuclease of toxin-antitoxin system
MNGLLLDTHVWIWYISGNSELSRSLQKTITEALSNHNAYLAAISLWEIAMLDKKQRIILEMPCLEWINRSVELTHVRIAPLTSAIATESCHLPGSLHDDPADRMLAATARVENLTLVTRDARLLAYSKQKFLSAMKA